MGRHKAFVLEPKLRIVYHILHGLLDQEQAQEEQDATPRIYADARRQPFVDKHPGFKTAGGSHSQMKIYVKNRPSPKIQDSIEP